MIFSCLLTFLHPVVLLWPVIQYRRLFFPFPSVFTINVIWLLDQLRVFFGSNNYRLVVTDFFGLVEFRKIFYFQLFLVFRSANLCEVPFLFAAMTYGFWGLGFMIGVPFWCIAISAISFFWSPFWSRLVSCIRFSVYRSLFAFFFSVL